MSSREIYLDHAATTPVDPIVADTMARVQARCYADPSSPHITTIAFPGIDRQAFMMAANLDDIAVATGTACASGSQEPAPSLIAMNLSKPVIQSAIRFSFGYTTNKSDLKEALEKICQILINCTKKP